MHVSMSHRLRAAVSCDDKWQPNLLDICIIEQVDTGRDTINTYYVFLGLKQRGKCFFLEFSDILMRFWFT